MAAFARALCMVLLTAVAFASPVVKLNEDFHYDLPDMQDVDVYKGLILNTQEGTVDIKDLAVKLDSVHPGHADVTASLVDLEIKKYTLKGSISVFSVEGDGSISLKVYPEIKLAYTPLKGSLCAAKNSTHDYAVTISKIECAISGLKVDHFINIGGKACSYLQEHSSVIASLLQTNMNEHALRQYVDPFVVGQIAASSQCKAPAPKGEFDVDAFITKLLVAYLEDSA